jgi:hypothetical protein
MVQRSGEKWPSENAIPRLGPLDGACRRESGIRTLRSPAPIVLVTRVAPVERTIAAREPDRLHWRWNCAPALGFTLAARPLKFGVTLLLRHGLTGG